MRCVRHSSRVVYDKRYKCMCVCVCAHRQIIGGDDHQARRILSGLSPPPPWCVVKHERFRNVRRTAAASVSRSDRRRWCYSASGGWQRRRRLLCYGDDEICCTRPHARACASMHRPMTHPVVGQNRRRRPTAVAGRNRFNGGPPARYATRGAVYTTSGFQPFSGRDQCRNKWRINLLGAPRHTCGVYRPPFFFPILSKDRNFNGLTSKSDRVIVYSRPGSVKRFKQYE